MSMSALRVCSDNGKKCVAISIIDQMVFAGSKSERLARGFGRDVNANRTVIFILFVDVSIHVFFKEH